MIIKFTCGDETVCRTFPPMPAVKFIPDWYKKIPFYENEKPLDAKESVLQGREPYQMTIRACEPVKDYLSTGYVIRLHSDIVVTPDRFADGSMGWWTKSPRAVISNHSFAQCPVKMNDEKNVYIKIRQPWTVVTPAGYSSYFYQPDFLLNDKIKFFPAVVDTDSYDSAVNFPAVITSKETFVMRAGDPLMVVFPFKRENWSHEIAVEKNKPSAVELMFKRGYKKLFHKAKSFK